MTKKVKKALPQTIEDRLKQCPHLWNPDVPLSQVEAFFRAVVMECAIAGNKPAIMAKFNVELGNVNTP